LFIALNKHAALGFFFNGKFLSNESGISWNDIGERSRALYCFTNRTLCCSEVAGGGRRGLWRFPNGTNVPEISDGDVYWVRAYSSVILNRRGDARVLQDGKYTCLIPDDKDIIGTLHIYISVTGIYDLAS